MGGANKSEEVEEGEERNINTKSRKSSKHKTEIEEGKNVVRDGDSK